MSLIFEMYSYILCLLLATFAIVYAVPIQLVQLNVFVFSQVHVASTIAFVFFPVSQGTSWEITVSTTDKPITHPDHFKLVDRKKRRRLLSHITEGLLWDLSSTLFNRLNELWKYTEKDMRVYLSEWLEGNPNTYMLMGDINEMCYPKNSILFRRAFYNKQVQMVFAKLLPYFFSLHQNSFYGFYKNSNLVCRQIW